MNGKTLLGSGYVGWTPGPQWRAMDTADFNGDGRSDILLQNAQDGACFVWEMNDKALVDSGFVAWTPGASWVVSV